MTTRSHFQEELEGLERSAPGGLELVVQTLVGLQSKQKLEGVLDQAKA